MPGETSPNRMITLFLVILTILLVMQSCGAMPSSIPNVPKMNASTDVVDTASAAMNAAAAEQAAYESLPPPPLSTPTVPQGLVDEETVPTGMDPTENFSSGGFWSSMFGKADSENTEGFTSGCADFGGSASACAAAEGDCGECTEPFGQAVTPTPVPLAAPAACPPSSKSPLVYSEKILTKNDSEAGCWPGERPGGDGAVSGACIAGGNAKVANFFDAAQTQTVLDALDRDPTREMKIRSAPATANYDLRAAPPIKFNGYPTLSFIKGNSNTGLKSA